jgi:hypothetical protein
MLCNGVPLRTWTLNKIFSFKFLSPAHRTEVGGGGGLRSERSSCPILPVPFDYKYNNILFSNFAEACKSKTILPIKDDLAASLGMPR